MCVPVCPSIERRKRSRKRHLSGTDREAGAGTGGQGEMRNVSLSLQKKKKSELSILSSSLSCVAVSCHLSVIQKKAGKNTLKTKEHLIMVGMF